MLFEEFFKKKKINLTALQQGDQDLFSEFKEHYEQMGEKSFDHTKKYWFNKLRRQFPLPPEVKAEKLRPENQIAEQTVADTLTEPSPLDEAPKLGFKPKFKAAASQTPSVENNKTATDQTSALPSAIEDTKIPAALPKVGFKPRFKAGVTAAKPADEPVATPPAAETTNEIPAEHQPEPAKLGFKPRFKAGVTTAKPGEAKPQESEAAKKEPATPVEEPQATDKPETPVAKPAYKPRFTPNMVKRKPPEEG